jgi:hypothetical protein
LALYRYLKRDGDYSRAAILRAGTTPDGDPVFTTAGLMLRPWYIGDTQPQSAYFRRVEPEIVSTAACPTTSATTGLPHYDVPVCTGWKEWAWSR